MLKVWEIPNYLLNTNKESAHQIVIAMFDYIGLSKDLLNSANMCTFYDYDQMPIKLQLIWTSRFDTETHTHTHLVDSVCVLRPMCIRLSCAICQGTKNS